MALRTFIYAAFTLLVVGCTHPARVDDDTLVGKPDPPMTSEYNRGTLWYGVAVHRERLDVTVRLLAPPTGSTRFFLPGPWAGRSDHADALAIGQARGPDGPAFLTIDRSAGRIDIDTPDLEWVELRYSVDLSQLKDHGSFRPGFREGVAVLFGPTFLVLPSQQVLDQTREIPVEVHVPDAWNVMTTWSPVAEKPSRHNASVRVHGFIAQDGKALRDAFLVTGEKLKMVAPPQTPETTVGFSPRFKGDREAIASLVGSVLAGYRETFDSLGPTRVFVDVSDAGPDAPLGGVGRRGGFVLNLPSKSAASPDVALLVAHEALHLWNGHHLVPHPDAEEGTRWFKEGVTHYLAIKYASRWGLIDFDFASGELAQLAANYQRNPLSQGRQGRKIDRMRFPYDQGALLALEVDAALARSSLGKVGVEDWLREVGELADDGVYNRETLAMALREVSTEIGSAAPAVMRRHLDATRPIDLSALFHRADLHWLPSDRSRGARVIGLERKQPLYTLLFRLEGT